MGWTKQGSHPAWGMRFFLLQSAQTDCGAHPVSYTMVPEALYLGVKRSGREADHSSAASAQVRNKCRYTPTPHYREGRDSSVSIAILYGLSVLGSNPSGGEVCHTRPDRPGAHPAFSTMGTESLSPGRRVKRPGCVVDYPPPYMAEVKESGATSLFLTGTSWLVNFTYLAYYSSICLHCVRHRQSFAFYKHSVLPHSKHNPYPVQNRLDITPPIILQIV
jgi:hypothetical protein